MQRVLPNNKQEDVCAPLKDAVESQMDVLNSMVHISKKSDRNIVNKIAPMITQLFGLIKKESEITSVNLYSQGTLVILDGISKHLNEENASQYEKIIEEVMRIKINKNTVLMYRLGDLVCIVQSMQIFSCDNGLLLGEIKKLKESLNKSIEMFSVFTLISRANKNGVEDQFKLMLEGIKRIEAKEKIQHAQLFPNICDLLKEKIHSIIPVKKLEGIFLFTSLLFASRSDGLILQIENKRHSIQQSSINDFLFLSEYFVNCILVVSFVSEERDKTLTNLCEKLLPFVLRVQHLVKGISKLKHLNEEIYTYFDSCQNEFMFLLRNVKNYNKRIIELFSPIKFRKFKNVLTQFFLLLDEIQELPLESEVHATFQRIRKANSFRNKFQKAITMIVQFEKKDVPFGNIIMSTNKLITCIGMVSISRELVQSIVKQVKQNMTDIMKESPIFIPIFSFGIETQIFVFNQGIASIFVECQQSMKYLSSFVRNSKDGGVYHNFEQTQTKSFLKNSYLQKKFSIYPSVSKDIHIFFSLLDSKKFRTNHDLVQFVHDYQMELCSSFTPQREMVLYCVNEIEKELNSFFDGNSTEKLEEITTKTLMFSKICYCFISLNQTSELNKYRLQIDKQIKSFKSFRKTGNVTVKMVKDPIHNLQKSISSLQRLLKSAPFDSFSETTSQCHSGRSSMFQSIHSLSSRHSLSSTQQTNSTVEFYLSISFENKLNETVPLLQELFGIVLKFRSNGKKKLGEEEYCRFKENFLSHIHHCFIFFFDSADIQHRQITTNAIEMLKQYLYCISSPSFPKYYNLISDQMLPTCLVFFSCILDSFYQTLSQRFNSIRNEIEAMVRQMEPSQIILFNFQKKCNSLLRLMDVYVTYFELYEPKKNITPISKFLKWTSKLSSMALPIDFKPFFFFSIEVLKPTQGFEKNLLIENYLSTETSDVLLGLYGFDSGCRLFLKEEESIDVVSIISCYETFVSKTKNQLEQLLGIGDKPLIKEIEEVPKYCNSSLFFQKMMYCVTTTLQYIFPIGKTLFILRKILIQLSDSFAKDEEIAEEGLKLYLIITRYYCLLLKYNYIYDNCGIMNKFHFTQITEFIDNIFEIIHFLFCQNTIDISWVILLKLHISLLFSIQFSKLENLIYPVLFFVIENQDMDDLQQRIIIKMVVSIQKLLGGEFCEKYSISFASLLHFAQPIIEHFSSIEKYAIIRTLSQLKDDENKEKVFEAISLFYGIVCDEMYLNIGTNLYNSLNSLRGVIVDYYSKLQEEKENYASIKDIINVYLQIAPPEVRLLVLCFKNFTMEDAKQINTLINGKLDNISVFQTSTLSLYLPTLNKLIESQNEFEVIKQIISIIISVIFQPMGNVVKKSVELQNHLDTLKILSGDEPIISFLRKEKRGIEKNIFEICYYMQLSHSISNTALKCELLNNFDNIKKYILKTHLLFDNSVIESLIEMIEIGFNFVASDFFVVFDMLYSCQTALLNDQQNALKQAYRLKLMWCEIEPFSCYFEGHTVPSMTNTVFSTKESENTITKLIDQIKRNNVECVDSFKYIKGVIQYLFRNIDFATRHIKVAFNYYSKHNSLTNSKKDFDLILRFFSFRQFEKLFVDEAEDYEICLHRFVQSFKIPNNLTELNLIIKAHTHFNEIYQFSIANIIIDLYKFYQIPQQKQFPSNIQIKRVMYLCRCLTCLQNSLNTFKYQAQEVLLLNVMSKIIDSLLFRIKKKLNNINNFEMPIDIAEEEKGTEIILSLTSNYTQIKDYFVVLKNICEDQYNRHVPFAFKIEITNSVNIPTILFSLGQLIIGGVSRGVIFKCFCVLSLALKNQKIWEFSRTLGFESVKSEFTDKLIVDEKERQMLETIIANFVQTISKTNIVRKSSCSIDEENVISEIRFAILQVFVVYKTNHNKFILSYLNQITVCLIGIAAVLMEDDQSLNSFMTEIMTYHDYIGSLMNENTFGDISVFFKQIHLLLNKYYCVLSPNNSVVEHQSIPSCLVDKSLFTLYTNMKEITNALLTSNQQNNSIKYSNFISVIVSYNKNISVLIQNFINSFFVSHYLYNEEVGINLKHPIISLTQALNTFSTVSLVPFTEKNDETIRNLFKPVMVSISFHLDVCFLFSIINNSPKDVTQPIIRRMLWVLDTFSHKIIQSTSLKEFPQTETVSVITTIASVTHLSHLEYLQSYQKIQSFIIILLNCIDEIQQSSKIESHNKIEIENHISIAKFGLHEYVSTCIHSLNSMLFDDSTILLVCSQLQVIISEILSVVLLLDR